MAVMTCNGGNIRTGPDKGTAASGASEYRKLTVLVSLDKIIDGLRVAATDTGGTRFRS
jgi:hypothetical protein